MAIIVLPIFPDYPDTFYVFETEEEAHNFLETVDNPELWDIEIDIHPDFYNNDH